MTSKKLALLVLGAVLLTASAAYSVTQAHAQTSSNSNYMSGLVQMVAQKFGLDQSSVQAVFDQYHTQQLQNLQTRWQQKIQNVLTKEVQQGKINDSQKQAIIDELNKLQSEYSFDSLKNMTPSDRKVAFQKEQSELSAWAKSQNINLSYIPLRFGFGMGMHKGWFKHPASPTPTP